jgi:site-specific recombinase XerD
MNTSHFRIIQRTETIRKDGTSSLYLYANINGVKKYFTTGKAILTKHWNSKTQKVSANCNNYTDIQDSIDLFLGRAKEFTAIANIEKRTIDLDAFERMLRGDVYDQADFIAFMEHDIKNNCSKYEKGTIANYKVQVSKLKFFRSKLPFVQLNPFFWREYESHLIGIGNNPNTVHKAFRTLKVFIHRAIEQGIIQANPFLKVRVERKEGKMQYLTREELHKLEKIYSGFLTKELKKTLRYFLFACYTGLRYSDIKELKHNHIFLGEHSYVEKEMFKTSRKVNIPLIGQAKKLIPEKALPQVPVFNAYCNQVTNRHLKSIMKLAGINKPISFHCARHTFATITLGLSGDIAVVSKMLGHTKIETTQIYAKVQDEQKRKAMGMWNIR